MKSGSNEYTGKGFNYVLFRETLRRRTLARTVQNLAMRGVELSGKGIDLGGNPTEPYYKFISFAEGADVTFADLEPKHPDVLKVDIEKGIPVEDNSQDFLILMNVIEHIYDYNKTVRECYRVLKPGGKLIGVVPFLYQYHGAPDDHFRFTGSALKRIFEDANFSSATVKSLGYGRVTAGVSFFAQRIKPKPLGFLFYIAAMAIDRRFYKHDITEDGSLYPLSYLFTAVK